MLELLCAVALIDAHGTRTMQKRVETANPTKNGPPPLRVFHPPLRPQVVSFVFLFCVELLLYKRGRGAHDENVACTYWQLDSISKFPSVGKNHSRCIQKGVGGGCFCLTNSPRAFHEETGISSYKRVSLSRASEQSVIKDEIQCNLSFEFDKKEASYETLQELMQKRI